jgi:hypothetical protein
MLPHESNKQRLRARTGTKSPYAHDKDEVIAAQERNSQYLSFAVGVV